MSLFGVFDLFIEAFVKYHDNILGKSNRKYISFSASIFLFVFLSNLLGLFPGMAAITTTVWVNVAIALVVFIYFNAKGIEVNGWIGHLKHFCGPLWWLAWFMFPIELLGAVLRILTLNLRLYWNINADHLVLGIFTDQFKIMGSFFYGLGLFVSFMQAFIFTTLTMVYILLSVQHSEKH
jgi:F-type H+-transporting ATPase subunit a